MADQIIADAQTGAGIDGGGAADITTQRHRNHGIADRRRQAHAPVQGFQQGRHIAVEMAAVVIFAFLNQHHRQPTTGQFVGGYRAASTAADHDGIHFGVVIQPTFAQAADLLLPAEPLGFYRRQLHAAAEFLMQRRVLQPQEFQWQGQCFQQQPPETALLQMPQPALRRRFRYALQRPAKAQNHPQLHQRQQQGKGAPLPRMPAQVCVQAAQNMVVLTVQTVRKQQR